MSRYASLGKRILAMVLSIVMILSIVPTGVFSLESTVYGEVTALTAGAVVNDSDPANVEVVIEETKLEYVEGNAQHEPGWWVGIKVAAPAGFSQGASYMVKSNPNDAYDETKAKSFVDNADGANKDYIELWFSVSPDSLAKFIKEDRSLIMMYAFDWNADDEYEQEITFKLVPSEKIVLTKNGAQEYPYAVKYGTATPITDAEIDASNPENVKITVKKATLQYVEGNSQRGEGWWVGTKVAAPDGFSKTTATYMVKNSVAAEYDIKQAKSFVDNADGDNKDYIELWFLVTPDYLAQKAKDGGTPTMMYAFDWNGDAIYGQEITFSLEVSDDIVLMKGEEVLYPHTPLEVALTTSNAVKNVDTNYYYNKDNKLTITADITGATVGGHYDVAGVVGSAKNANGEDVSLTFTKVDGEDFKYTYTYEGADVSLSNIKVTVSDKFNRTGEGSLAGTYIYDTTAPTLELTVSAEGKEAAMQLRDNKIFLGVTDTEGVDEVTFNFVGTVVDENYQGSGINKTAAYAAGDLTNIELDAIEDLAGNKLSAVSVRIGTSVLSINCDSNGKCDLVADMQKPYSPNADLQIVITDGDGEAYEGKVYNEDNLTFKAQIVDGEGVGISEVTYAIVGEGDTVYTAEFVDGFYQFPMKDILGQMEGTATLQVTATDKLGNKSGSVAEFIVDTKTPGVAINMPAAGFHKEEQTVSVVVTDANFDADNSTVSYKINGEEKNQITWVGNQGTISVTDGQTISELTVTVKDKAGHSASASNETSFCVDTTPPVIEITMPKEPNGKVEDVEYYNTVQTVTVKVTDVNFNAVGSTVSYMLNGEKKTAGFANGVCSIDITEGQIFSDLQVRVVDSATHSAEISNKTVVCVDTTDPTVKVTKTVEAEKAWQHEESGVDYYNGKVTYTVEIADTNLQESTLTYKLQGQEEAQTVTVDGSYDLVLEDGQILTELSVHAKDKASNEAKEVDISDSENKTTFNNVVYNGNKVCVDYTDPTIKVTKTVEEEKAYRNSVNNVDYYNGKVTYTVEIADTNLQESTLTYKLQGQEEAQTVTVDGSYDLVLEDGQMLTELSVYAKDKANEVPTTVEVVDADDKTAFEGLAYSGHPVIVDATAPTATLDVSGNLIKDIYVRDDGTIFVKLENPTKGDSGAASDASEEKIVLKVTVSDKNLTLDCNDMNYFVRSNKSNKGDLFTGVGKVNEEATVTYTQELSVDKESHGTMIFNLTALDLAGNELSIIDSVTINDEPSDALKREITVKDGTFNGVMALDRRRPGSNDNTVPEIVITADKTPTTSTNELDLFDGAFNYSATIKDTNAGLKAVDWAITDANGVVKKAASEEPTSFTNLNSVDVTIPVELDVEIGETNDVILTIVATDNVGNVIKYEKKFAVDTKAPVVEVTKSGSYANTVAEGEGEERKSVELHDGEVTFTATVKDINLADYILTYTIEGKTSVSVEANQWTQDPDDTNKYFCSFTLTDGDVLTDLKVEAQDKANNQTAEVNSTESFDGTQYIGNYVAVDMTAPAVTVTKNSAAVDVKTISEGSITADLYNDTVTYTIKVEDKFLTSGNGAVAVVSYKLEGNTDTQCRTVDLFAGQKGENNSILSNNMDVFTNSFTLGDGDVLLELNVEVKDNAGKVTTGLTSDDELTPFDGMDYAGNRVVVDMTAPAVTVTKSVEDGKKFIQSIDTDMTSVERIVDFYDGMVTYTIRIEDQFMARGNGAYAVVQYKVAGEESWLKLPMLMENVGDVSAVSNNADVFESAFTLPDGAVMTDLEIVVNDTIGRKAEVTVADEDKKTAFAFNDANNTHAYTGNDVCVDKTVPVVSVEKKVETEKSYIQSSGKTDYYSGEVTYQVTASDINLTNAAGQMQQMNLTYQFEGDKTATVIALPDAQSGWTWQESENGQDTYAYEFTVEDGKVLTKFEIQVVDNAGNKAQCVDVTDADKKTAFDANIEEGIQTYNGKLVAVDKTAPVVTVEKIGTSIQSYDGHDYYAGAISYKVTVKDTFLNKLEKSVASVVVTYMDGTKSQNVDLLSSAAAFGETESNMDSYVAVFKVDNGDAIKDIQIIAVDNADNNAKEVGVTDADNLTTFQHQDRTLKYTGNVAVVDMTAPTAKVEITGQIVDSFYTYNGVTYVRLKNPGKAMSGEYTGQADETVTLKVTVSDKNLTLDIQNRYGVKNNLADGIAWAGAPAKNQDGTVTYTKSVTVPAESTGIIEFELTVFDLAGNAVSEVKVASINETDSTKINQQVQPKNGVFGTTISLDRRRPSSIDDSNAPVIVVKPSISNTISNNELELFNSAFNFALNVTDGQNNANNSGIDKVQWIIEDEIGFVKSINTTNDLEDGVYNQNFTIPVELVNAIGESNSVKLTIIATDNVGNVTEYIKDFAVDTQKPAVVISYDNNDVMNGKYFKADRKVTITVSDINFEPATTTITTQVNSTGWSKNGDVYTTTCTYNVDGIYTLDMVTTDRANNTADIDFTNNGANAAPVDFVLDKTAPVINVTYNPANPVDRDGNGVHYFNVNRNLTVKITEVNFDPANQTTKLVANLGANNALGAWISNGDVHTASETFTEGNNYQVKIDYTDLAGNPATTYSSETFSVDLSEPTIEITSGELTNSGLNIVQDDLVLGFTINDKQDNLKNFKATLLFLDKEFKQQEVSGAAYYTVAGENDRTTGTVTFTNIAKEKTNDGIYTVRIAAEDYAGHKVELTPELVFSLNRFGSTFSVEDEATRQFLTPAEDGNVYQNRASSLKIIERNPNRVYQSAKSKEEGSLITISVNGNSIQLSEGADYLMEVSEKGAGANKWYEYTYEILASNFFDGDTQIDGRYEILFYSVDAAGNSNTNESNEGSSIQVDADGNNTGKLSFVLDHKAPVLSILDLNEKGGTTFDATFKRIPISVSDNTPCTIEVYIDDVRVELNESMEGLVDTVNWLAPDGQGGYILNISASDAPQDVRVVIKDAAGNVIEQHRQRVLVSDNFWVRYINNYWAVGGTIAGLAAVVFLIVLLAKRRKKKEEQ